MAWIHLSFYTMVHGIMVMAGDGIKQNIGVVVLRFLSAIILYYRLLILHFIDVDLIIKMYNLICTSGYYSVYNERQIKKRCIKKSYIIATNKSKFSLQQIADNLNKKIPKVRLTTLSISDLLLAVNSNAILNIGTLNVKSDIEGDICVPSNNNYDTEQCNTNQSFNLMFCDNTNDIENGSAYLTEDVFSIDEKPNTLIDSSNNIMSDLLLTADSNTALNIGISNVNNDIKDNSTILNKPSDVTENVECDEFDSTFIIYENANVDKFKNPKKSFKILSEVPNMNNILVKETTLPMLTEKTDNIPYNNMQLSNKCSIINNNNASSNANETYILDNISTGTLAPPAEFTFIENQLKSNYEINDNNTDNESDSSITSKNSFDDSFHTSDCSMFEDTDEDKTKNTREYITNTSKSKTVNSTLDLTSCLSKVAVWDDRNMYVETSGNSKSNKLNMCPYCKKLQTVLTRHLERIHKNEEDVKKFSLLPKGNSERKKIINILRRTGNFIYNTDSNINKGDLIVCRRPKKNKQAADFIPCAKCKGFFAKSSIRHHFRSCVQKQEPQRNVKLLGRTVACRIHQSACTLLRRLVFPVMREDNITQIIRYDELLIAYGNKLCQNRYRPQHQHDMIRARLRLLGRFLIVLRDIDNSVIDFTSIYDPTKYEQCIKVVHELAQFDETTGTYKILSVASSLGRYIKQVGQILKSMCIKKQEFHKQTVVEDFLKLFTENYIASINKIILETQEYKKRGQKNIVLPSIDDIEMFNTYLKFERTKALQFLQTTGFSIQAWRMLAETTLVSIMVFNRRHPGELERVLIENLKNCAAISKEEAPELYKSLSKYVRMTIRNNLGRLVPVLLHEEILKCMQMIVDYRKHAGVPENNPYIFGIYTIDKNRYKYLRASILMRKHSIISGLKIPISLRNTMLWKHIATVCISLAISEHEVNDLTDFKRHHKKYKSHYKQSVITNLAISRLFKYTQGEDTSDESDNVDEDENENDLTNDSNIDSILNISDTLSALTKTRQSEQLPIKEKDFNNHINNIKKNKVNRPLAPKRKIIHNSENMTESDDECNTELDLNISNTLSLKETKQTEEVFGRKNNVNNNTERNKKKSKVLN